jgi:hypothetical protein
MVGRETGSVTFWDDQATARHGPGDHGHLDGDQVLSRVTLEGDIRVGPGAANPS